MSRVEAVVIHDYKNVSTTVYFYQDKTCVVFNDVKAPAGLLKRATSGGRPQKWRADASEICASLLLESRVSLAVFLVLVIGKTVFSERFQKYCGWKTSIILQSFYYFSLLVF